MKKPQPPSADRAADAVRYIALLRAINVGGRVVKMDRLRTLFETAGFDAVETFIASGNVVFDSSRRNAGDLERTIESHLKKALGYPVATFVRSMPELSAIVLRQPGSERNDGYVTASEWAGYNLNADLVVLSACETGLGKHVAGEGIMGLPYALFVAGSRNTLLSIWKVPDASAAEFMIRFFRRVRAGASKSVALAQTKREFLSNPRYRDPVHWAGFVLYGS